VDPITPKSSADHSYILAATDYFSKWAEAIPLREVKKENVVDFIRTRIIYRYDLPRYIITDNGKPFVNKLVTALCENVVDKRKSSMYNAPTNGLAEAFNKTLCNLLIKVVAKSKSDWHERLGRLFGHTEPRIRRQPNQLLSLWYMGSKQYCLCNSKSLHSVLPYRKA